MKSLAPEYTGMIVGLTYTVVHLYYENYMAFGAGLACTLAWCFAILSD